MKRLFLFGLMLGGMTTILHDPVFAQSCRRPHRAGCCATCDMPMAQCSCTQTRPVVQTQIHAQQVTTYRDVVETHVRNETVVQNVPVTTYKNVTVDEGNYQMVWVPKPVTKQVAETVIQQQAATRAVPFQVTRRVPQISTQLVPVQTVQHVTETVPMMGAMPAFSTMSTAIAMPAPVPMMTMAAPGSSCKKCNASASAAVPTYYPPTYGTAYLPPAQTIVMPTQVMPAQVYMPQQQAILQPAPITPSASLPMVTTPTISVPTPRAQLSPIASPMPEQWQPIPTRPSAQGPGRDLNSPTSRSVPVPTDDAHAPSPRSSRFTPAPSTAIVWNSRLNGDSIR